VLSAFYIIQLFSSSLWTKIIYLVKIIKLYLIQHLLQIKFLIVLSPKIHLFFRVFFREFANWLRFQSRGDGLHDEARGLVDLGGTDLRRARLPNSSEIPAHNFSTAPPQVTISGVTGYTSTGIGPSFDAQLQASRLLGSHPSLGGVAPPQDSLTASLHIFTSRPWRSNSLTPPGCVTQQVAF
jgi:hypothetical protein